MMLATGSVISGGVDDGAGAQVLAHAASGTTCAATHATGFIYIGELCRYLMTARAGPHDREHRVRGS